MEDSNGTPGAQPTPADAARRIRDSADTVIERGKEAAQSTVERGVERAAGSAESAASALRRAADELQDDNAWIGAGLRKAAQGLERASDSLSGGNFGRALDDLNGFARRQPALFLGASLALGFALARVGKTAVERAGADGGVEDERYNPMPGL
jgi:hypothetical protein